ncbi:hypothetical protein WG908_15930 [Sphingobium sp. AN641]|uniref:hypothetical protein n=1 Tax=Sphingobium sp. AN641 TaxID=3133443 RepID=UPI0030C29648
MTEQSPWEPDRQLGGNWRSMFEQSRSGGSPPPGGSAPAPDAFDDASADDATEIDPQAYRPWILQRGRSRVTAMLGLRWYEPKAGFWSGCGLPYPMLQAVEYVGDRMVSLDYGGTRQFVIEGRGLDALARHIKQGTVLAVVEYAASIWPERPQGMVVTAIKRAKGGEDAPLR